jgi:Ca2+-binding RTX toxin-like protein
MNRSTKVLVLILALGALGGGAAVAVAALDNATAADCQPIPAGVKCNPGNGQKIAGGKNGSTSHNGWPAFTGILWQVTNLGTKGYTRTGTQWADELLGRNGSDTLNGGDGNDVLWGDSSNVNNGSRQHDRLDGGAGNDWIYGSHGTNTIKGGAGNDKILAAYGHGTIDCGPGYDTYGASLKHYKVRNCEHKVHKLN